MSTTDKFLQTIDNAVTKTIARLCPKVRLGTVKAVSGHVLGVLLDGDERTTPVARFCDAAVGDRVLVIIDGTQYYALGARK